MASLRRLARSWPKSLTLASLDGELVVLDTRTRISPDGDSINPDAVLDDDITGIPNTGGAW